MSMTGVGSVDQRYYASLYGRFNTADPMASSAMVNDPATWNRYAYVAGDPVNRHDRSGNCYFLVSGSPVENEDAQVALYEGLLSDNDIEHSDSSPCGAETSDTVYDIMNGQSTTFSTTTTEAVCPPGQTMSNFVSFGNGSTGTCDVPIGVNYAFINDMEGIWASVSIGATFTVTFGGQPLPVGSTYGFDLNSNTGLSYIASNSIRARLPPRLGGTAVSLSDSGTATVSSPVGTNSMPANFVPYLNGPSIGVGLTAKSCGQIGNSISGSLGFITVNTGFYLNLGC